MATVIRRQPSAPAEDQLRDPAALHIDADPGAWVLDGRPFDAIVTDRVTAGSCKSTIEAASTLTLTVSDSDRKLLRSGIFAKAVDLDAIGLEWSLASVNKTGDDLELIFEDRRVAELRRRDKPRKVARDQKTRAEFIKMLVDEVDDPPITFVSPELHKTQPIGTRRERRQRELNRDRGLPDDADLQGKEGKLSKGELRNAERALDVADDLDSPERATLALLEAGLVEGPDFNNPVGGEGTSSGMLQLTSGKLGGSTSTNGGRRDIELVCRLFLTQGFTGAGGAIALAKENPDWSPGRIAQTVQGSDYSSRYAEQGEHARAIYDAYGGTSGTRERSITETKRYEFSRGRPQGPKGENTWECALRLADEVGWRRFVVRDRFYYISEDDLISSMPRAHIREHQGGVDNIDFEIDGRHKVDEATVSCRAPYWKVPPGAVVIVEEQGLADGRWLVSEVDRPNIYADDLTVSMRRGAALLKEKPEPAPETVTRTIRMSPRRFSLPDGGGRQTKALLIYEASKYISSQGRPYVFGGGHGPPLKSIGKAGLDCSSSVSLALWLAGAMEGDVAQVSGWFASNYGVPGPGEFITIWAHGGHVWIEFNLPGLPGKRFDTSPHGNGGPGPRLRFTDRSHAGFTARHPA